MSTCVCTEATDISYTPEVKTDEGAPGIQGLPNSVIVYHKA